MSTQNSVTLSCLFNIWMGKEKSANKKITSWHWCSQPLPVWILHQGPQGLVPKPPRVEGEDQEGKSWFGTEYGGPKVPGW